MAVEKDKIIKRLYDLIFKADRPEGVDAVVLYFDTRLQLILGKHSLLV